MRLFYKKDGAVMVLLVLVLVPMLVICSLMVDASRVQLAKPVVQSSADLAVNSMLSQYDSTLNDYFGLLATATTTDDMKKKALGYFEDSLRSQNIEGSYVQEFLAKAGRLLNMESDEDIVDLLQIELDGEDAGSISKVADSGLDNSEIMKTQIVNFMKYRAPINVVSDLVSKYKELTSNIEESDSGNEADLIDAREDVSEVEGDVFDVMKQIYDKVTDEYDTHTKALEAGENYKKIYSNALKYCKTDLSRDASEYRAIHTYIVCSSLLSEVQVKALKVKYKDIENDQDYPTAENMQTKTQAAGLIDTLLLNTYKSWKDTEDKTKQVTDCLDTINAGGDDLKNYIDHIGEFDAAYQKYRDSMITLGTDYLKLEIAVKGKLCPDIDDVMKESVSGEVADKLKELDLAKDDSRMKYYMEVRSRASRYWQSQGNRKIKVQDLPKYKKYGQQAIKSRIDSVNQTMKKKEKEVEGKIKSIAGRLTGYKKTLNDIQEDLESLSDLCSSLETQRKKYVEEKDNYQKALEDTSDGSAVKKALQEDDAVEKNLDKYVTEKTIRDFQTRVTSISAQVETFLDEIDRITYFGTSLSQIGDLKTAKQVYANSGHTVDVQGKTYDQCVRDARKNYKKYYKNPGKFLKGWLSDRKSNPVLTEPAGSRYTKLYRYICEYIRDCKGKDTYQEKKYKKKDYTEYKKKSEDSDDGSTQTEVGAIDDRFKTNTDDTKSIYQGADSSTSGKTELNLTKTNAETKSVFGSVTQVVANAPKLLRDSCYTIAYVDGMFTCDTTINETLCEIARKNHIDVSTLSRTNAALKNSVVCSALNDQKLTSAYAFSLTNKEWNNTNNPDMGNEIEYILYGGGTKSNKVKSWGSILSVRFVMNAIYGFANYYRATSRSTAGQLADIAMIEGISDAICAATYGVVPASLVKIAIILGMVVTETIYDRNCMKSGMKVPLMKTASTWSTSLSSVLDDSVKNTDSASDEKVFSLGYSDYLDIFLLCKLIAKPAEIYGRIGDVVETNMKVQEEGFSLEDTCTWYKIDVKTRVKPVMLAIPFARTDSSRAGIDFETMNKYQYSFANGYY